MYYKSSIRGDAEVAQLTRGSRILTNTRLRPLKGGLYTSSIRGDAEVALFKIQVIASGGQIFSATFTRAQCSLVFDIWLGEDLQAAGRTVILREAHCYHNG